MTPARRPEPNETEPNRTNHKDTKPTKADTENRPKAGQNAKAQGREDATGSGKDVFLSVCSVPPWPVFLGLRQPSSEFLAAKSRILE